MSTREDEPPSEEGIHNNPLTSLRENYRQLGADFHQLGEDFRQLQQDYRELEHEVAMQQSRRQRLLDEAQEVDWQNHLQLQKQLKREEQEKKRLAKIEVVWQDQRIGNVEQSKEDNNAQESSGSA